MWSKHLWNSQLIKTWDSLLSTLIKKYKSVNIFKNILILFDILYFKKIKMTDNVYRDGLDIKSICCSSRGLK